MKATFKLNGVKKTVNLPTCWEEAKFGQLLAYKKVLRDKGDGADELAVFTGIDAKTLRDSQIENLPLLLDILSFVKNQNIEYALPKTILGYDIPDNLEIQEIQRYGDMELIIKEFTDDEISRLERFPLIISTYVVNPYNFKHAEGLAPQFLDAPALEVLAVGNFTLMNMTVLKPFTPLIVRLAALPRNNWRQGMRNFIARLAFTVSFYFLKRKLPLPVRRYLNGRLATLSTT